MANTAILETGVISVSIKHWEQTGVPTKGLNWIYSFLLDINLACLFYPINVKTAKPIKPKFCVGPHMAPGRVLNDHNSTKFFVKIRDFFVLFKRCTHVHN